MTHGDGQGGERYVEGPRLRPPAPLLLGPFVGWKVSQLHGSQGADNIVRADHFRLAGKDALGQEFVDIDV